MNKILYSFLLVFLLCFSVSSFAGKVIGNVYAMTNDPSSNQIAIYERYKGGKISFISHIDTGGSGAGNNAPADPLGSQNSVIISDDGIYLYAVNVGSNQISAFKIRRSGNLKLLQTIESRGAFPVILTIDDNLLYVLNAGGEGSIVGYEVHRKGTLSVIEKSIHSLGLNNSIFPNEAEVPLTPGQVGFDRKNRRPIITNADSRELLVYHLNK